MTTPPLPARDWEPETAEWWEAVWASPMAAQFADVDQHALLRLAVLIDDYWTAGDFKLRASLAGEIRAQSKAFGLAPLDRRVGGFPTEIGEPVRCEWCGEAFAPSRRDQRFCKPAHRAAASDARRRR